MSKFDLYRSRLERYYPLPKGVRIKIVADLIRRTGYCAMAYFDDGRPHSIELDNNSPATNIADDLVHEWAHLVAGTIGPDHGVRWGIAYSHCYRIAVEGWKPKPHELRL